MDRTVTRFYRASPIWAAVLGLVILAGLLDFIHEYIYYLLSKEGLPWGAIAYSLGFWWLSYAALVVIALLMARRFMLIPGALTGNLGLHLLTALLLGYVHTISNALLNPPPHESLAPITSTLIVGQASANFPIDFVSYWAIIGFSSAFYHYSIARGREEQSRKAALHTRSFIEASLDPLVTFDRGGTITDANQAAELVTGFPRETLIGSNVWKYFTDPEKAHDGCEQVFARRAFRNFPLKIRSASGKVTDVLCSASVFKNEAGELEGAVGTARDISDLKQLEEQLLQSRKMEAIGRLAGGVAHDFNNILMIASGSVQLLKRSGNDPAKIKHYADVIQGATDRGASLTRQLLAFSRQQVLNPTVLDLNVVVTDMWKMVPRLLGEDINSVFSLDSALGQVSADRGQIEQVIMNLAVNARDAMPHGGKLKVETTNVVIDGRMAGVQREDVPPGCYVQLAVSDTGMGMGPEVQAQIFDPFFTTKEPGKGTGLGLATVYGIVKQSGGYISAYSEIGKGTTFKIYLPRVESKAPEVETTVPDLSVPAGSGTILLVEDEGALREVASEYLRSKGYEVVEAGDGESALEFCKSHKGRIDLLITDIVMPGCSGPSVAKAVLEVQPGLRTIFMSGYADRILHPDLLGSNATFFQKPFSLDALALKVHSMLSA
jgi:two-component system, cell cycle sensor histidine kinase and response regulator CckA